MTDTEAIDAVIAARDGTASSAARRAQLLILLNHLNTFVHNFREWSWTWTSGTITITAGNRTSAISGLSNFQEFGQQGGLFDPALKVRYREISFHEMDRIRFETSSTVRHLFCVRGENLEIPFAVTSNLALTAIYRRSAQVLADNSTTLLLPDRYCRTVIVPGLTRAAQQSKDDVRSIEWASELRDGLSQMCTGDNPGRTSVMRWPYAVPGAW